MKRKTRERMTVAMVVFMVIVFVLSLLPTILF